VENNWANSLDYISILRGVWRRRKVLVVVVFLGLTVPLLAYVYITSQPLYMSTATISIEPSPLEESSPETWT